MHDDRQPSIADMLAQIDNGDPASGRAILQRVRQPNVAVSTIDEVLDGLAAIEKSRGDGIAADLLVAALFDQPFLWAETHRVLLRPVEVEESMQETMLAVIGALPSFHGTSSVRTWARAIARNTAIGLLRKRRERTGSDADIATLETGAERFSSMLASRADLAAALQLLPPEFEQVVRLRDVEHLPYDQIADQLGIKLNTVRSRLARGRARLAAQLGNPS